MRIVQLANFHTPTSGGLRTVLDRLGRHYASAGHQVYRVVPGAVDETVEQNGVLEIRLRAPLLPGGSGYRMITDRGRLNDLLRRLRPEAVELSDKTTLVAAAARRRRVGVRVVAISHERIDGILRGRLPAGTPLHWIADVRNRQLAAACDAVVCASEYAAAEFHRVGAPALHRVPLGVDLDVFTPIGHTPRTGTSPIRLVSVGRLSDEKHPAASIEVVRHLLAAGVATVLTIVGDGPLAERLQLQARGLPVRFRGHVASRAHLARLVADADVCLCPCPVETFGLAALEAQACGTPIVVPDLGALRELVDGAANAGRVVPSLDWSRRAVPAVLDLVERAAVTRPAARANAERFSWDLTGAAMLALLDPSRDPRLDPTRLTVQDRAAPRVGARREAAHV